MSSPLEGRIRSLAREEVAAAIGGALAADNSGAERIEALEQAVTSLHGTLLRLDARIDVLEKAAGQPDQETRPAVRRTRKADG